MYLFGKITVSFLISFFIRLYFYDKVISSHVYPFQSITTYKTDRFTNSCVLRVTYEDLGWNPNRQQQ